MVSWGRDGIEGTGWDGMVGKCHRELMQLWDRAGRELLPLWSRIDGAVEAEHNRKGIVP